MNCNLLPKHRIRLLEAPADWKEILRQGCLLLEQDRLIAKEFYSRLIEQTERLGPYMVLADGFALPHLMSPELVFQVGFALIISAEAVDFLGEAVKAFLIMATPNSSAHIQFLSYIAEELSEPENLQRLLQGDFKVLDITFS